MPPLILFGAFDRHNFGDLLLAHVAAAKFRDRALLFAGVAERDLRPWGGHQVRAIATLAREWGREWGNQPADLCHVGGEILTCSLYEAAVMTLPPVAARQVISRYDAHASARQAWAQAQLGLAQGVAYMAPKHLFTSPGQFSYRAVGGVDLPRLPPAMQAEIRACLTQADEISVRDHVTQSHLAAWDIHAPLQPDPGERVAQLFGDIIARHATTGAPAAMADALSRGYAAVQFSADFGDDATLKVLADQMDQFALETGLGICLFRAGAAPWHDEEAVYRRLMGFMQTKQVRLFASLHLWDICALLSHARAYCGSSLHGRIVTKAYGVPGISLSRHPGESMGKVRAYGETWWSREDARTAPLAGVYRTLMTALAQ